MCVLTCLSHALIAGDVFIKDADAYADYRESLLSATECQNLLTEEPEQSILLNSAHDFVEKLKNELSFKIKVFDEQYPSMNDFVIDDAGIPSLKKIHIQKPSKQTLERIDLIHRNMPERSLLDILCKTHHATGWAHEFEHLSGSQARFEHPVDRYILTTFCYGTGMGPTQTAKHIRPNVSAHMLTWVNQHHVNINTLKRAKDRVVNYTKNFMITEAWGDGKKCAADGTLCDIYENNLLAESHFRYMAKGGIAYHHISDTYVALFSTFMRCGLWEAVAILDGLLQNDSIIRPTTVHADTQGQSTVVFGLAYLLGIQLMPRIRNWQELKFFKADRNVFYENIDALFTDVINWDLIETHWNDLVQVVLSIKQGKISSTLLLKKLGSYSRKNKLYLAFQELGFVIRTLFLLEYLSKPELRQTITATTNKVESYNAFSQWVRFASDKIVASNDVYEMEKAILYNLIANNCLILQNTIDITDTVHALQKSGITISKEDLSCMSPYITSHIRRFGDILFDFHAEPIDVERIKKMSLFS
jgi:TnpA family transposase